MTAITCTYNGGTTGVLVSSYYRPPAFAFRQTASTGVADSSIPSVSVVTPAAGTTVLPSAVITLDVADPGLNLSDVVIIAKFSDAWEVVFDGSAFSPEYAFCSRSAITGGYRYSLTRVGGWPGAPTLSIHAVDTAGNAGA